MLPAVSISENINDWLLQASHLHVLHATEKVINLFTDTGKLVSLVPRSVGNGPHNIVVPIKRFDSPPTTQDPVTWNGSAINVDGFTVELSTASTWKAEPDWPVIQASRDRIQQAVPQLVDQLRIWTPDWGVLSLLGEHESSPMSINRHFVDALVEPGRAVVSGLQQTDLDRTVAGALDIAGVGTGLTPAGDDFLSGVMLACWAGFCDPEMLPHLPLIALRAGQKTTPISAAYLASAAKGQFGVIWHLLLEHIIQRDTQQTTRIMKQIVRIGHNSGAYTLTGFLRLTAESYAAVCAKWE
ncbi:MAG: DUF2877 domain-containing protein [Anaerolineales bacterium]|jgi:hypothetical protein